MGLAAKLGVAGGVASFVANFAARQVATLVATVAASLGGVRALGASARGVSEPHVAFRTHST